MCRSPSALEGEIDQAVAGELLQHMVEKADAGGDVGAADAVEKDAAADLVSLVTRSTVALRKAGDASVDRA